jgi:hypothetical protein
VRYYDGSVKWATAELSLSREGYGFNFACTYDTYIPSDFAFTGKESGWEIRRKMKAWCEKNGVTDYRVVRNTSYLRDLHGSRVYELWTRLATTPEEPTP